MVDTKSHKDPIKTFVGLSSFQVLAMFRRGLFYTYLSIYLKEFLGLSVTETTLFATLPMIMSVIFQNFIWGPISDKSQRRRTLIISGEILAGIGTISVFCVHSVFNNLFLAGYVIIIGLSCVEIFWSMSNIGWSALISDIYPNYQRDKITGQLISIGAIGRIFGISIGGLLYEGGLGFRNGPLFYIASIVMFISTIPMLFTPEGGITLNKQNDKSDQNNEYMTKNHLYYFTIFIISLIFINFGRNSISILFSQFLNLESGLNVQDITLSFIVNARSIAILIFGFSIGFLRKKIGSSLTLIMGILINITALLITAYICNIIYVFIGSFLMGTGEVLIMASSYAIASNLIPEKKRARLFGLYNMTFFLSWGLASTIISGPLIDLLISQRLQEFFAYQVAFLVGTILCFIGLVIFVLLKIKFRRISLA